ncbi:MAG TPA: BadF/BadG/BcrA/BcrD ATPase family protein [Candidatus Acidoferrum sp.]|nr:BadF/BadG/BcrA/BcrD ATPase family protein [Candidatus Acidoferrum sp.]
MDSDSCRKGSPLQLVASLSTGAIQRPNTAVFRLVIAYPFHMRCVLGFDGGGTKTECVLMDESGGILARSRSGPSNPTRVGVDAALAALIEAAEKALTASSQSVSEVVGIYGAVAGVGTARATPEFIRRLKLKFPNANVAIDTDLAVSLAAIGEKPSIVVIAGTGSAVFGTDASGSTARDGGFGPVLGDPGSAYENGRKALVMESRRLLSGEVSYLRNEILGAFKCNWVDLQDQIRANPDSVLPKIFPLVTRAANEGDESARVLLPSAARELSEFVARVVDRLKLGEGKFFLAKTGGVFGRSPFFDNAFDKLVLEIAPKAKIGPLPAPVADFCARAARDCLDGPVRRAES